MKSGKQMERRVHEYQLLTKVLAVNGLIEDQSQCCLVTLLACNQRQMFNGE